jgi:hypothetical protein
MVWYAALSFLLSLLVVLYLHSRKPNVVKIFQVAYTDAYYETSSTRISLIRGVSSITHIHPFDQLNKQDIDALVAEYIKLPESDRALSFMLEHCNRFGSVELLKILSKNNVR